MMLGNRARRKWQKTSSLENKTNLETARDELEKGIKYNINSEKKNLE